MDAEYVSGVAIALSVVQSHDTYPSRNASCKLLMRHICAQEVARFVLD